MEPAFITDLFDIHAVFYQQLAGMADSYFTDKLGIGFPCSGFKIPAK